MIFPGIRLLFFQLKIEISTLSVYQSSKLEIPEIHHLVGNIHYLCFKEMPKPGRLNQCKTHPMQTLTIELTDNNSLKALQELEHKRLIRIVKEPDINSYALPGEPISAEDFKKWVEYAEDSATVSLAEAKQRWATQKKKLQKLIR